jgi:hypothetical protein
MINIYSETHAHVIIKTSCERVHSSPTHTLPSKEHLGGSRKMECDGNVVASITEQRRVAASTNPPATNLLTYVNVTRSVVQGSRFINRIFYLTDGLVYCNIHIRLLAGC